MGLLVNGEWRDTWYDTGKTAGRFVRHDSSFRNWVTVDGSPGPSGKGGFKAEPGRYHLYIAGMPMGLSHSDISKTQKNSTM
jgi:glutathionyl-hydroquinone reductase